MFGLFLTIQILFFTGVFTSGSTNLAYNKRVGASTVFHHFHPESAVDGYLQTFYHSNEERNPYLWIDLGKSYKINRVDVFSRQYCCGDRLHTLEVTIGNNLSQMFRCGYFQGPAYGNVGQQIPIRCNVTGRYVKLRIIQGPANTLEVAEVKVFGW